MNVLVVGFAVSGKAAARLMKKLGHTVFLFDDGGALGLQGLEYVDRSTLGFAEALSGIDLVIISPSVLLSNPLVVLAKDKGVKVVAEVEAAYQVFDSGGGRLLAITGTNGKTTTTMLAQAVLEKAGTKCQALGNIGIPFSDFLNSGKRPDMVVLEVSSFQLEGIDKFCPEVAMFLNLAQDHLDRHKDMTSYFEAKMRIFKNQTQHDWAILNADCPILNKHLRESFASNLKEQSFDVSQVMAAQVLQFSTTKKVKGAYLHEGNIYFDFCEGEELVCNVDCLRLKGKHNLENALAVVCAAKIYKVPNQVIAQVFGEFELPSSRIQFVSQVDGVSFYNDSKGTNAHATIAAAASMQGSTALILGGSDKGEDFGELFKGLAETVEYIFVTGENADKIVAHALDVRYQLSGFRQRRVLVEKMATLRECVTKAFSLRPKNVLLSPASASFDRYANYEMRGKAFEAIVRGLEP